MSREQIDFQDVLQLVELIKASSNFSEIRLRSGDIEIELRRHGGAPMTVQPSRTAPASQQQPAVPLEKQPASPEVVANPDPATRAPGVATPPHRADRPGATIIRSPMVGTVYHAPEPGAAPFVTLGQRVTPDQQICIVEVMKLMNSINAGCHGVISEILVGDGQTVEHGQELFVITTD